LLGWLARPGGDSTKRRLLARTCKRVRIYKLILLRKWSFFLFIVDVKNTHFIILIGYDNAEIVLLLAKLCMPGTRVARCYNFIPKIPNWLYFREP
jgi:hypothetical protein